jgi:hypothetical protein
MIKFIPVVCFFLFAGIHLFAQETTHRINFCVELPLNISVIPSSNQSFTTGTTTIYLPKFNNYRNPVYGINVGMIYPFSEKIFGGVVIGINGSFYQNHLYYADEYLNMLSIPVMARFSYSTPVKSRIYSVSDISGGYNFYHNVAGNTTTGFDFEEKGGMKAVLSTGLGYKTGDRMVTLQVGYDITGYNNKARVNKLVSVSNPDSDFITYKTWYQTLTVKLGIWL